MYHEMDNKLMNIDPVFYPGHDEVPLGGDFESNIPSRTHVYAVRLLEMIRNP